MSSPHTFPLLMTLTLLCLSLSGYALNTRSYCHHGHLRPQSQLTINSWRSQRLFLAKRRTIISKSKKVSANDDIQENEDEVESNSSNNLSIDGRTDVESLNSSNNDNKVAEITSLLQDDIKAFTKLTSSSYSSFNDANEPSKEEDSFKPIKDLLSIIFIADFFVVIVFLLWFLLAAALQSTNPFLLEKFQDIFNPVVVPALTVLMVGSIASGLTGDDKVKNSER